MINCANRASATHYQHPTCSSASAATAADSAEPSIKADKLDLTVMDTAEEASQFPLLDPAFQISLAFVAATLAGRGVAQVTATSESTSEVKTSLWLSSRFSPNRTAPVSGLVDSSRIYGQWLLEPQHMQWQGGYAGNSCNLELDGGHLSGSLGSVEVDLNFASDGQSGMAVEGTLGGKPYSLLTKAIETDNGFVLKSVGELDGQALEKSHTVSGSASEGRATLAIEGEGQLGDVYQQNMKIFIDAVYPI